MSIVPVLEKNQRRLDAAFRRACTAYMEKPMSEEIIRALRFRIERIFMHAEKLGWIIPGTTQTTAVKWE